MTKPPAASKRCTPKSDSTRRELPLPVLDTSNLAAGKVRASRSSRWRAAVLIAVHVAIIGHIIHWKVAGRTLSPVEPSESMYTLQDGLVNAGFIFFISAIAATLVFGRFFCGWGCHVVALQDLCSHLMKRVGVRPKAFRSRLLVFVPLAAAIYMFVWPSVYRVMFPSPQTKFAGFSNHLMTEDFWKTFPGVAVAIPFLLICGFGVVYFLGSKGYCTYACPYGGFFGLADKVAPGRIRVTDACEGCGHCTAVCTSNVQVHAEVRDYGMVVDPGCMKCLDCVSVCPNDALYFGFGWPSLRSTPRVQQVLPRRFDLTWPEEILAVLLFAGSFVAFRGMFVTRGEAIPFLMALGIAGIVTFVTLKLLHLFRQSSVSIQNIRLKSAGKLRRPGWIFAASAVLLFGVTVHAGVMQYHLKLGERYFARTGASEELVLSGVDPATLLNADAREAISQSRDHLRIYRSWAWIVPAEAELKLAWLALLDGRRSTAAMHLREAVQRSPDSSAARFYLASVLALEGATPQAVEQFKLAVELSKRDENADLARRARFMLGNALAASGDLDQAITEWRALVVDDDHFAPAHKHLVRALLQTGDPDAALQHAQRTVDLLPEDAEAHFQLGVTLVQLNREPEASRHFARAIALDDSFRQFLDAPVDEE